MPETPRVTRLEGRFSCALTVDVEEWYHTCLVPGYVHPELRPRLPNELDRLIPELLQTLADHGCTATFFILGEAAERLPRRVREIAEAGHEVASHGYLHLRACERSPEAFLRDLRRSKQLLEDIVGERVLGFRAPEWSLRSLASACLPLVAEAGFAYDSSLAPYPLAGRPGNPKLASRLRWMDDTELLEFPPLTFGGPLRIPAGSWTGRLANPWRLVHAAVDHLAEGGLPVVVVHPWEISGRPTPGTLTGFARFIHETGRNGFEARFRQVLRGISWRSLCAAAALDAAAVREPRRLEAPLAEASWMAG